jgi:hypothetical protein
MDRSGFNRLSEISTKSVDNIVGNCGMVGVNPLYNRHLGASSCIKDGFCNNLFYISKLFLLSLWYPLLTNFMGWGRALMLWLTPCA